jgi:hypothetical protein
MYPTNDTLDNQKRVRSSKKKWNRAIPRSEVWITEIPTRSREKMEEAEMNGSPIKLPKIGWHKWVLEWWVCEGERERKCVGVDGWEKGTEKKRREEGERNRGGAGRSTKWKPVQPVIKPVQPVSGQTAQ